MGIEYSKYGSIYEDLNYHVNGKLNRETDTESDTQSDTQSDTHSDTESDTQSQCECNCDVENDIEVECCYEEINKDLLNKIKLLQDHIDNLERRILKLENSKLRCVNL